MTQGTGQGEVRVKGGWGRVWLQFLMLLYAAGGASQVRVYNLERGLGFRWVGLGEIECESDSCPTSVSTPKAARGGGDTGVQSYQETPD